MIHLTGICSENVVSGGKNVKKGNPIALLPIGVFLVIYLGLGLLFEYGLKIPMGFYNIPIVIAFLLAISPPACRIAMYLLKTSCS